jgi:antitoxin HicB
MNKISKQDWDTLRYPISLRQLSDLEGGGWLAAIPMLGQAAFTADGETAEEALQELEALRRDLYEDVVSSGQPIPMPQDVTEETKLPSGKWIIRTSPSLHAELQEAAKSNGLSFNAYCNHMLERGHATSSMHHAAQEAIQTMLEEITARATEAALKEFRDPRSLSSVMTHGMPSYKFNKKAEAPPPTTNPLRLVKAA